jgi:tRNA pseudouridine38-40 synthase
VGMLVQVGSKQKSLEDFTNIWQTEDREKVKYAAPPQGLCLLRVGYNDFPFSQEIWYETQPYLVFGHRTDDGSLKTDKGKNNE